VGLGNLFVSTNVGLRVLTSRGALSVLTLHGRETLSHVRIH